MVEEIVSCNALDGPALHMLEICQVVSYTNVACGLGEARAGVEIVEFDCFGEVMLSLV